MIFFLALSVLLSAVPSPSESDGQPLDFTLPTLKGKRVSLSQFRGKVILLNFWATRCAPCGDELPQFERLQKKFAGRDVVVLAVNVDGKVENARKFMKKNDLRLIALWDGQKKVAEAYGVETIPSTFVIDRQGTVRFFHKGYTNAEFKRIEGETAYLLETPVSSSTPGKAQRGN